MKQVLGSPHDVRAARSIQIWPRNHGAATVSDYCWRLASRLYRMVMCLEVRPSAVFLLVDGSGILSRGRNELYKMEDMFSNGVLLLKD